ncbi:MAG TPA: flagellar basal body-associated FliL family protein [Spirochaetota bacterium]|nr:flagellar basal body-associated FliL family protein [Spirochaetota bacterium]
MEILKQLLSIISMRSYDGLSILVNIAGGILFAKLVYMNMMKKSLKGASENNEPGDIYKTIEVSHKNINFNNINLDDIIKPVSAVSMDFYRHASRVIKLRLLFITAVAVLLLLALSGYFLKAVYLVPVTAVMFTAAVITLLIFYVIHLVKNLKVSKTLVVLRVFGSKSNTRYLFNSIVFIWNYLGASFTIMDPVYARSEFTIFGSPKNFVLKVCQVFSFIPGSLFIYYNSFGGPIIDFVFVIISTLVVFFILLYFISGAFFIKDTGTLLKKVHKDSNFSKSLNGTGKQINLYCFDNIWKKALREMLGRADVVLMDLRGFSRERKGCAFELSHLVNSFDLERVLFLVNGQTDQDYIRLTLQHEADKMSSDSPNAGKENLNITIYSCKKQNRRDTRQVLRILCNKLSGQADEVNTKSGYSYESMLPLIRIPSFIFMPLLFGVIAGYALIILMFVSYIVTGNHLKNMYEQSQDIIAAPPLEPLATYELPPFAKATSDEEPHFLKLTLSLGYYASPELTNELIRRKDEMQHIINILLRGKRYKDLDSVSDSVTLSEEIKTHINIRLTTGKVKEIYFKEFVLN